MVATRSLLALSAAVATAVATASSAQSSPPSATCNYSEEEEDDRNFEGGGSPPIFLPQDRGSRSPAALDGTPYGFYHVPSATNSTKWTVYLQPGGWCYDEVDCYCRSQMHYGTSTLLPKTAGCSCMNPNEDGSMARDCNCLYLPYLDGGSFSGHRAAPVPVPAGGATGVPAGATVTFRGLANLDGVVAHALAELGMRGATELVVTGASAGGLSTFLHADRVVAAVRAGGAPLVKVAAAPVVGYFLDAGNAAGSTGATGPNTQAWSNISGGAAANYTAWMEYAFAMQNMTFGPDGALHPGCEAKHPTQPHLCFMSPHMQEFIETPFFMFNSRFDEWQLLNELQTGTSRQHMADDAAVQKDVIGYGALFLDEVAPVGGAGSRNGAFITTCICHSCPWSDLVLNNKTADEHYADWFYGKTSGASAKHVDIRMPNGDGTLNEQPKYTRCDPFPNQTWHE